MLFRISLSLAVVLVGTVAAADPVTIAWRFKQGDTFYVLNESTIDQVMTVMGMKANQKIEQASIVRFAVKSIGEDRSVVLEQTIVAMKQKGDMADPKMAQRMKGVTFTVTLDKDNKLTKFEGYKDFLDKLSDGNPAVSQMLASVLSEDTFKQAIQETFSSAPNKKVDVGNKWEQAVKISLGPLGDFRAASAYTYEGKKDQGGRSLESVAIAADLKYTPPGDQPQGLPFRVTNKSNLKVESFKGSYLFDATAGRLVEAKADMEMSGKMVFNFDGREVEMGLEQKLRMRSRVSDKEPVLED